MRQTRRSRSTAATPQKDGSANQPEEVTESEKTGKNLETVFEKETDVQEEVGAPVEPSSGKIQGDNSAVGEPSCETEDASVKSEPSKEKEDAPEVSPVKAAASPQKGDSGVIELNCKVCNCSFTNYQEHMSSESHKSKISHSSPKSESQSNVEKPVEKVVGQAQKRSGDQVVAPSPKRMRNQNQNASNAAAEKFHCDVCKLTMVKLQDFEHHMGGKRHMVNLTRAQGKFYCDICKLFFNTNADLNDHTESQLHKNNLAERKQDRQPFECKLCNITSLGQKQHEQHLSSRRHRRSLEHPAGSSANAVNGKVEPEVEESNKKWLYLCNACNFGCSQDQEFSGHMNLADHKAAVMDMKKKGLVREKGAATKPVAAKSSPAKPAVAKPFVAKSAVIKPAGSKPVGPKPLMGPNAAQNVRKFQPNNPTGGPRNFSGPSGVVNNASGLVTKVTYNVVTQPNTNAHNVPASAVGKPGPIRKDGPQANRKPPVGGASGPRKNMQQNKPNIPANKPPLSGRPNARFPVENQPNNFVQIAQPMNLGFQKVHSGNFGPVFVSSEPNNSGGNYGNYGSRPVGMFNDNLRNDNINLGADSRGDFRTNMRDEFIRDVRDIRDIRNIDLGDNRGDASFRAGFYREVSGDVGRNVRGDYGNNFRTEIDARSDMRSGLAADSRGDVRSMVRNDPGRDMAGDIRGYANNDIRDLRSDTRSDYMRERSTLSGYAGYSQQSYRSNDDYRSDSYGRAGQTNSGQGASAGSYSGGMMAGGRYDYMDRSSAYTNQYGGSSRGTGYMGNMALNGR